MSRGISYQLPDLLALPRDANFELHTNPHCHPVSLASEKYFVEHGNDIPLAKDERETLHGAKIGLLAALCFPTCDVPQLRTMTDFLVGMVYAQVRMIHAGSLQECGWDEHESSYQGVAAEVGLRTLSRCGLFRHLIPSLARLFAGASLDSSWRERFASSVTAFHSAQSSLIGARSRPGGCQAIITDEYLRLRAHASGLPVVFALGELIKELRIPPHVFQPDHNNLASLLQCTSEIIVWVLDIVSYNIYQANGNQLNLITVLMSSRKLTLQGALKVAYACLRTKFDDFKTIEAEILQSMTGTKSTSNNNSLLHWAWRPFCNTSAPASSIPTRINVIDGKHEKVPEDLRAYIHTLKDIIIGIMNWTYETEIYFGQHGEEVRTSGWAFLKPPENGDGGKKDTQSRS